MGTPWPGARSDSVEIFDFQDFQGQLEVVLLGMMVGTLHSPVNPQSRSKSTGEGNHVHPCPLDFTCRDILLDASPILSADSA